MYKIGIKENTIILGLVQEYRGHRDIGGRS